MMGHAQAVTLLENKDNLTEEDWVFWPGGRTALVVQATSYPSTLQLQMRGPDGNPINLGNNLDADGIANLDLPAGSYRMNLNGGTATDVYVQLCKVPY